jgi:hypothetical protein
MAVSMEALTPDCFSEDLFALAAIGAGLGEDTILSRRLRSKGRLVQASRVYVEHPSIDATRAYSRDGSAHGYATAYSRRAVNDAYRGLDRPTLRDRWSLITSYVGCSLLLLSQATVKRSVHDYALGYWRGALHGFLRQPTAQRLTPDVRWRSDAEAALSRATHVSTRATARGEILAG